MKALATGEEHKALIAACHSLACAVDRMVASGEHDDKLWREYRLALGNLMEAASGGASDGFEQLVEEIRRAEVRDSEDTVTA